MSEENVSLTKKLWFSYILLQISLLSLNNLLRIRTSLKVIKNINFGDTCTSNLSLMFYNAHTFLT